MPYIARDIRPLLKAEVHPKNPGELNYAISQLVRGYIATYGLSYTTLNAIIGVLECLKMEVYRRIAAPYEDSKMSETGDVF